MTLGSSGAIALSNLRGEFGGGAPDAMSEYYRGAGLVANLYVNRFVPTSGAIKLSDFYGASIATNFSTTLTRGTNGQKVPTTGFQSSPGSFGSLANASFFRGTQCIDLSTNGNAVALTFIGVFPQNFFITLTTSLGVLAASSAVFSNPGGTTSTWVWTGIGNFASSGTETVTING